MDSIDFILNLTGLLIWINWRTATASNAAPGRGPSLVSTLQRPDSALPARWLAPVALILLLGLRSVFYWHIGSGIHWVPGLSLGGINLQFRSDYLDRMAIFSALSFAAFLGTFYVWLLFLSAVNGAGPSTNPWSGFVRLQLGWIDRWPAWTKLLLPFLATAIAWLAVNPVLIDLGLLPAPLSAIHRLEQTAVVGLGSYLVLKYLLAGVMILYLLNSYVYLGSTEFLNFVNLTGRNVLRPFRRFPLRMGKIDFRPLAVAVAVWFLARLAEDGLVQLFQNLPLE